MDQVKGQPQKTIEVKSLEIQNKKSSEKPSLRQVEAIDLVLKRHIRVVKFANYIARAVESEVRSFQNEIITDTLVESGDLNRGALFKIDSFIENINNKLYSLSKRIFMLIEDNLSSIRKSENYFFESSFSGLSSDQEKRPDYTILGSHFQEHLNPLFLNLKKEITGNYRSSVLYSNSDFYLLEKFRGTKRVNYKDSIFSSYYPKIRTLVKSLFMSYASECRFFNIYKNKETFPYFAEALPLSESKKKKTPYPLGIYKTEDFSIVGDSEPWFGCLAHFNSTLTQVPVYSIEELNGIDLRDWFFNQSRSFQESVLGEKKLKALNSKNLNYSQIFDFSNSRTSLEQL